MCTLLYVMSIQYSDSQFLNVLLHLELPQNTLAIFPVLYSTPLSLSYTQSFAFSHSSHAYVAPPPPLSTGNNSSVLLICESTSFLLHSLAFCIFILHI